MRGRPTVVVGVLTFLLAFAAAAAPSSSASTWSTFYVDGYGARWPQNAEVHYKARLTFPSTTHLGVIKRGGAAWNSVGDAAQDPDFYYDGTTSYAGDPNNPCNATINLLHWRDLDYVSPNLLGLVTSCQYVDTNRMLRFTMSFDSDSPWYVGTGTPGRDQYDLWSVASHEFGHGTGWFGHFMASSQICQATVYQATMCPLVYSGTTWQRALDGTTAAFYRQAY